MCSSIHPSIPLLIHLIFWQLKASFKYHFISQNYIILFEYLQKAWKIGIINSIVQMENLRLKNFQEIPQGHTVSDF